MSRLVVGSVSFDIRRIASYVCLRRRFLMTAFGCNFVLTIVRYRQKFSLFLVYRIMNNLEETSSPIFRMKSIWFRGIRYFFAIMKICCEQ